MRHWTYQGKPFTAASPDHYGFIYLITCRPTGRRYIGKKCFYHRLTRPPLSGRKRRRIAHKESNWKTYFGSCAELLQDVKRLGPDAFTREILQLSLTKREHTYAEVEAQIKADVLTAKLPTGEYAFYNENILNRFFR